MPFFRDNMKYIDFNIKNPRCIHCYISDRAYASVITEVMANGQNETGGVFLGYIINRAWYIVESVDPGVDTVNQVAFLNGILTMSIIRQKGLEKSITSH